ncbi:MAG: hypothetical protein LBC02_12750 [Planctomycetaceae bacterium]|jgi:hypothetical protein|nr:hypothetical protein [Planctomycetaceae bacterium]
MSKTNTPVQVSKEELLRLLDADSECSAVYHPMFDDVFVSHLAHNLVTNKERQKMITHLTRCTDCCEEFKFLCEHGVLVADEPQSFQNITKSRTSYTFRRKWFSSLTTIVATLLLCFCIWQVNVPQPVNVLPNETGAKSLELLPTSPAEKPQNKTLFYFGIGFGTVVLVVSLAVLLKKDKQ